MQAEEKESQREDYKKKTREDDMAEIYNALTSDLLTENPDICQSSLGLQRKIGFLYKGMSCEERQKVREEQLAQIEEAKVNTSFLGKMSRLSIHSIHLIFRKEMNLRNAWREKWITT